MKRLETIVLTATLLLTMMLPTLPVAWWMAPGCFLLAAAIDGFFGSLGMACIAVGFLAAASSTVFAFVGRWGAAAGFGFIGACIFGATVLLQLLHFHNPVGSGLWILLAALAAHSFFSVKWYFQSGQESLGSHSKA